MDVTIKINGLDSENIRTLTEDVADIVRKYDADYFKIEAQNND